ncbi:MAG: hypothetical protein AAFU03_16625 [Bacteroidota bacterium]
MSSTSEILLLLFATLGWVLTIYFGFFRFKHYQWAKKKVQYDLFTRINQKSDQLFIRTTTLSSIKGKNQKISAKRNGVLSKYLETIGEKLLLLRNEMIPSEVAQFWLKGIVNELCILREQDADFIAELRELQQHFGLGSEQVSHILAFVETTPLSLPISDVSSLYQKILS